MDLICIKRRYKKVQRIVILSFIITLFIYTFLVVNHVQAEKRKEIIFAEDLRTIKQVMQEEKIREQEEIKVQPKPKILTTDEIQRLKNIYKTDEKIELYLKKGDKLKMILFNKKNLSLSSIRQSFERDFDEVSESAIYVLDSCFNIEYEMKDTSEIKPYSVISIKGKCPQKKYRNT